MDLCWSYEISIHAPAKGATSRVYPWSFFFTAFQSTLPRRERRNRNSAHGCDSGFQSTLPRRERLKFAICHCIYYDFNPRSREGSDLYIYFSIFQIKRFQSTLPRRERHLTEVTFTHNGISIHAPAKGATDIFAPALVTVLDFNPRSREGSDYNTMSYRSKDKDFNPRSREGSDQYRCCW